MAVERAIRSSIGPYMLIDGFVADVNIFFQFQITGDLFWTPVLLEIKLNSSRLKPTDCHLLLGLVRTIAFKASVTVQFSRNRRFMNADLLGNVTKG